MVDLCAVEHFSYEIIKFFTVKQKFVILCSLSRRKDNFAAVMLRSVGHPVYIIYMSIHNLHEPNHVSVHAVEKNYITAHIFDKNYATAHILDPTKVTAHILDLSYATVHK